MKAFDVAVVGQGYGGLRAARLARDRGLSVVTFEGVMAGGAVMTVLHIDPSPASSTSSGPDLGALLAMENMDLGVRPVFDAVTALQPRPNGGWQVANACGDILARHVVLATGTRPRTLNVPGEQELTGHGVSRCADCDGWRVAGQDCVVAGGGDGAFQQAAILAGFARSVTVLMRGDAPRARADLVEAAASNARIQVIAQAAIRSIEGDASAGVTAVSYDSPNGSTARLECAGVFIQVGGIPETSLLPDGFARDVNGALVVDADGAVDPPNLWAIGSVRAAFPGQLADAGDDARRAIGALLDRDQAIRDGLITMSP